MMRASILRAMISLITSVDSVCTAIGGCKGCLARCQNHFGYDNFCCYGNSCCCYSAPAQCKTHPACPSNNCKSTEGIDVANGSAYEVTCGVGLDWPSSILN